MAFNESAMRLEATADSGFSLSRVPVREKTINILVGLGGSGVDMLREAKGLINRVCCDDKNKRKPPKRVVYLGIDTDAAYLDGSWICSDGREAKLRKESPCSEQINFSSVDLMTFLDPANLDMYRSKYPYMFEWLNPSIKKKLVGGDTGACGVPQAGRAYLFLNLANIRNRLTELIEAARAGETVTSYNVFLLSGVSGGTGCGTYQDMAYALRKMVRDVVKEGPGIRVFGHLIMPDVNMMNASLAKDYVPKNGYTSLAALDHLTSLKSNNTRFQQKMAEGFIVDTEEPPFDYVHLFSHEDDGGHTPEDYYKHCMASGAQNILSFVAREDLVAGNLDKTIPQGDASDAVFAMDSLYSNIPTIESNAHKWFPERSYKYLSAGVAEYALPMDDILRYVTTLLFNRMDGLFKNEPNDADGARVLRAMGLSQSDAIAELSAGTPPLVNAGQLTKTNVFGNGAIDFGARFNNAIRAVREDVEKKAQQKKTALEATIRNVLEPYFTDTKYGPVWVNHLIIYYLIPSLKALIGSEKTILQGYNNVEADCERERDRISHAMIKTNNHAVEMGEQWNRQFRARVDKMAAEFLLISEENDLSVAEAALNVLSAMNTKWFNIVTEILTTLRKVSSANAEIVAEAKMKSSTEFVWSKISVPQISEAIRAQFEELDQAKDLVGEFTAALLKKADEWSVGQINVAAFLEEYFQTSLREIIDETMEGYLEYIFVTTGQYADLNAALQALFAELKRKATPMFHCSDAAPQNTKQYLLSVPASCTRIKEAADAFKAANGSSVVIQHSQVNFRISMQSVRCAIPMFAYEGLKTYESTYYQSTPEARLGCRLYDGPKAQWEHLPSPIPRRSRGGLLDSVPQTIRTLEEKREKSFYALLDTPALKLEKVDNAHDYNCVFYPSQRLDACGVWQMWQDANLKGYDGEWDRKKIEEVLAKLRNYRANGLPGDTEIVTEVGGGAVIRKVMILQECWKFADGAYKSKIENMLDGPEKEAEFRKACLQVAVEFYLSSMPTFEQGEKELEKYGELDTQIARLQAILDDMDRLPAECKQIIQILLTEQVALSEQGDRFLYKDPDGKLVGDVVIKCPNTVIKEWELLRQLRELENDENPHRSAVAKRIVKQAMTAYTAVKSSKDRDQMQAMQAALAELDKRVKTCCNRHTSALASGDSNGYTYTAKGLEFYETMARCITELTDELTDMMPAPAYAPMPTPVPTPVPGGWTCTCGTQNAHGAKFCSNCGSKPAPAAAPSGFCPNCGAQNAPGAKFCNGCGAKLGEPAPVPGLCPSCGFQNDPNAKFCSGCGTKLGGAPVTPPGLCTACGFQNAPGAKFCNGCGNTLN